MSRIDLHVDELFDRARAGALSASERARLLAHCEVCVGCRTELAWLRDGLHVNAPSSADRALAAGVVETLFGRDVEREVAARPARGAVRWWQAVAVAGAGLLLASAAAALYTGVQAWRARESAVQQSARHDEVTQRAGHKPRAIQAKRVDSLQPPVGIHAPVAASPQPAVVVAAAAAPRSRTNVHPSANVRALPNANNRAPAETREQRAETLFIHANDQRAAGDNEQALAAYAQLTLTFPETRSALAARISSADLLLRRMDQPERALAAYRDYLVERPTGALAEEARIGVATSLRQLGRKDQERTAWLELLDHHPSSLHAPRARERLLALSR